MICHISAVFTGETWCRCSNYCIYTVLMFRILWWNISVAGGATGIALNLQLTGRWFNSTRGKLRNNLGQVVHTYVSLTPSSITWYRPKGRDALRLERPAWRKVMAAYRRVDDLRSPAGWLPVDRDQLQARVWEAFTFTFYISVATLNCCVVLQ